MHRTSCTPRLRWMTAASAAQAMRHRSRPPAESAIQQNRRQRQKIERDECGRDSADRDLAFGTDIDDLGAKSTAPLQRRQEYTACFC